MSSEYRDAVADAVAHRRAELLQALDTLALRVDVIADVAALIVDALRRGNKVLVAGNGGSAADAQHFAAELIGRFKRERRPYAAISLTTDTSILTAVANDYGYEEVFSRQVLGLGKPGDVFVALSTSGESANLIRAAFVARELGITVVAITGDRPSRLAQAADLAFQVPTADTAVAQELHILVIHLICHIVESELARDEA